MDAQGVATPSFDSTKLYLRTFDLDSGDVISISQSEIGDVGCVVWDAAIVMGKYLEKWCKTAHAHSIRHRSVLELGAGTGFVGIVAACLGASVLITDLTELLELVQMNIDANAPIIAKVRGRASAAALTWGADDMLTTLLNAGLTTVDFILLSDCIYYEQSLEPLVRTLTEASGPSTIVLCCYEERTTGNKPALQSRFFELMQVNFIAIKIPNHDQHPLFQSDDIHLWQFRRRLARQ